jgi:hypothetical protein
MTSTINCWVISSKCPTTGKYRLCFENQGGSGMDVYCAALDSCNIGDTINVMLTHTGSDAKYEYINGTDFYRLIIL